MCVRFPVFLACECLKIFLYILVFFLFVLLRGFRWKKKDRRKNFKNKARVQLRTVMDLFFSVHKLEILSKSANLLTLSLFSSKDGRGWLLSIFCNTDYRVIIKILCIQSSFCDFFSLYRKNSILFWACRFYISKRENIIR